MATEKRSWLAKQKKMKLGYVSATDMDRWGKKSKCLTEKDWWTLLATGFRHTQSSDALHPWQLVNIRNLYYFKTFRSTQSSWLCKQALQCVLSRRRLLGPQKQSKPGLPLLVRELVPLFWFPSSIYPNTKIIELVATSSFDSGNSHFFPVKATERC